MSAPVLKVEGLNARYGAAQVLFDVALSLASGEVLALMGRNGAGKSTTLKAIIGLVDADGEVHFDDTRIDPWPAHRIASAGLGYVPEDRRVFADLSVMENLEVGRQPAREGRDPWTPERLFSLFPNLAEMRNRRAAQMSGGEQQMLTIARTLMGNPSVILLDEPSEGLAPVIVERMAEAVTALKAEGLSILLCEQNLFFAKAVSDRASVIEGGQIRWNGTMVDLFENEDVRRDYLSV
ncbi:MAG: ABC transporter ATP-binding protein [Pseudomonadota bacterium]